MAALGLSTAPGLSVASEVDELDGPDHGAVDVSSDASKFTSFDALQAGLASSGYREVHIANGNVLRLSAVDPEGSEVILTINPGTGAISSTEYGHKE